MEVLEAQEIDHAQLRGELKLDQSDLHSRRIEQSQLLEVFIDSRKERIARVTERLWEELNGADFGVLLAFMQDVGSDSELSKAFDELHAIFEPLDVQARDRLAYLLANDSLDDVVACLDVDGEPIEKRTFVLSVLTVANISYLVADFARLLGLLKEEVEFPSGVDPQLMLASYHRRYAGILNRLDLISIKQTEFAARHGQKDVPTYNDWIMKLRTEIETLLKLKEPIDASAVTNLEEHFYQPEQIMHTTPAKFNQPEQVEREVEAFGDVLDRYISGDYAVPFVLTNPDYLSAIAHFVDAHQEVLSDPSSMASQGVEKWLSDMEDSDELEDTSIVPWLRKKLAVLRGEEEEVALAECSDEVAEGLGIKSEWRDAFTQERGEVRDIMQRAAGKIHKFARSLEMFDLSSDKAVKDVPNRILGLVMRVQKAGGTEAELAKLSPEEYKLYYGFMMMAGYFLEFKPAGRLIFHLDQRSVMENIPAPFVDDEDTCETFISIMRETLVSYAFVNALSEFYHRVTPQINRFAPSAEKVEALHNGSSLPGGRGLGLGNQLRRSVRGTSPMEMFPSLPSNGGIGKRELYLSMQQFFRQHWTSYEVVDALEAPGQKKSLSHPVHGYCGGLFARMFVAFGDELSVAMRKRIPADKLSAGMPMTAISAVPEAENLFVFEPDGQFKGYDLKGIAAVRDRAEIPGSPPDLLFATEGKCKDPEIRQWRVEAFMWFVWYTLTVETPGLFCALEKNVNMPQLFVDVDAWIGTLPAEQADEICDILVMYYLKIRKLGKSVRPIGPLKKRLERHKKKSNGSAESKGEEKKEETPKKPQIALTIDATRGSVLFIIQSTDEITNVSLDIASAGYTQDISVNKGETTVSTTTDFRPGHHTAVLTVDGKKVDEQPFTIKYPTPEVDNEEPIFADATIYEDGVHLQLTNQIKDWEGVRLRLNPYRWKGGHYRRIHDSSQQPVSHVFSVSEDGTVVVDPKVFQGVKEGAKQQWELSFDSSSAQVTTASSAEPLVVNFFAPQRPKATFEPRNHGPIVEEKEATAVAEPAEVVEVDPAELLRQQKEKTNAPDNRALGLEMALEESENITAGEWRVGDQLITVTVDLSAVDELFDPATESLVLTTSPHGVLEFGEEITAEQQSVLRPVCEAVMKQTTEKFAQTWSATLQEKLPPEGTREESAYLTNAGNFVWDELDKAADMRLTARVDALAKSAGFETERTTRTRLTASFKYKGVRRPLTRDKIDTIKGLPAQLGMVCDSIAESNMPSDSILKSLKSGGVEVLVQKHDDLDTLTLRKKIKKNAVLEIPVQFALDGTCHCDLSQVPDIWREGLQGYISEFVTAMGETATEQYTRMQYEIALREAKMNNSEYMRAVNNLKDGKPVDIIIGKLTNLKTEQPEIRTVKSFDEAYAVYQEMDRQGIATFIRYAKDTQKFGEGEGRSQGLDEFYELFSKPRQRGILLERLAQSLSLAERKAIAGGLPKRAKITQLDAYLAARGIDPATLTFAQISEATFLDDFVDWVVAETECGTRYALPRGEELGKFLESPEVAKHWTPPEENIDFKAEAMFVK